VGQGGLGRRGDVARLRRLAVSHGAVLGQPALPRPVEPRLPLLRDGSHGGGAQDHPRKQRAHPAGDGRTRGGVLPAAHKAVLKSAAQLILLQFSRGSILVAGFVPRTGAAIALEMVHVVLVELHAADLAVQLLVKVVVVAGIAVLFRHIHPSFLYLHYTRFPDRQQANIAIFRAVWYHGVEVIGHGIHTGLLSEERRLREEPRAV